MRVVIPFDFLQKRFDNMLLSVFFHFFTSSENKKDRPATPRLILFIRPISTDFLEKWKFFRFFFAFDWKMTNFDLVLSIY